MNDAEKLRTLAEYIDYKAGPGDLDPEVQEDLIDMARRIDLMGGFIPDKKKEFSNFWSKFDEFRKK